MQDAGPWGLALGPQGLSTFTRTLFLGGIVLTNKENGVKNQVRCGGAHNPCIEAFILNTEVAGSNPGLMTFAACLSLHLLSKGLSPK